MKTLIKLIIVGVVFLWIIGTDNETVVKIRTNVAESVSNGWDKVMEKTK
jgi:hypothetical protein